MLALHLAYPALVILLVLVVIRLSVHYWVQVVTESVLLAILKISLLTLVTNVRYLA